MDRTGADVPCGDPIREAAALLDAGKILAIRGVGGFHLACIEESVGELKARLGRIEQPFAVMVRPGVIDRIAVVSKAERELLESPVHPIVVLEKRDHASHHTISNLHTIGCMLPYTGLHHLLFSHLSHPLLIMTSANMPGYPMITDTEVALAKLGTGCGLFPRPQPDHHEPGGRLGRARRLYPPALAGHCAETDCHRSRPALHPRRRPGTERECDDLQKRVCRHLPPCGQCP